MLTQLVVKTLPLVPGPIMRRLSSRYIAGETLESALVRLRELAGEGFSGILDLLGEAVESESHARDVVQQYCEAARTVAREKLDTYVSVKPTHVGLGRSEDFCFERYAEIAECCESLGLFLRVEMEDHTTTDGTLRVFERLRERFQNVGIVLQARLFRTREDIEALGEGPLDVRLVKGIYLEPEAIAHTDADAIREAYLENTRQLLDRGARISFATHDDALAQKIISMVKQQGLGPAGYEFQVLLGVQRPLWKRLASQGHRVRVYVPYGPDWRAYSTRRLEHNPEIVKHVLWNMFRT